MVSQLSDSKLIYLDAADQITCPRSKLKPQNKRSYQFTKLNYFDRRVRSRRLAASLAHGSTGAALPADRQLDLAQRVVGRCGRH